MFDRITGIPIDFKILKAIRAFKVARTDPASSANLVGGGTKKYRKAMEKMRLLSVWVLKITRVRPTTNIGKDAMWYSMG